MRFTLLAFVLVVLPGCPSSPAPGTGPAPGCESVRASLKAATSDHQQTIAAVGLKASGTGADGCTLTGICTPKAGTVCAEVTVTAGTGITACEMTFTSTTGQTFVASATVKSTPSSRCAVNGKSVQQYNRVFQPATITVDFGGATADAGSDGRDDGGDAPDGGTPAEDGAEDTSDDADGGGETEAGGEVADAGAADPDGASAD